LAQVKPKIPLMRMIIHDNIVKNQQKIDRLDGKQDHMLNVGNAEATQKATTALFDKVDEIRNNIEIDSVLDFNNKMKYLRGLNDVLLTFEIYSRKENGVSPDQISELIHAYVAAMELEKAGSSIRSLIETNPPEIGEVLLSTTIFSRNPGFTESKLLVKRRRHEIKPGQILPTLQRNPQNPDADSLIKTV